MKQKEDIMLSPEDTNVGRIERSNISIMEDPRMKKKIKKMFKDRIGRYKEKPIGNFNVVRDTSSRPSSSNPRSTLPTSGYSENPEKSGDIQD